MSIKLLVKISDTLHDSISIPIYRTYKDTAFCCHKFNIVRGAVLKN